MLKKFLLFAVFIAFCFLVPCFFIDFTAVNYSKDKVNEDNSGEINFLDSKFLDTKKIKLMITETNEILELSFDDYIKGVVLAEMPITYEIEALKAQAIVARTYTLYKLKNNSFVHENADMCDNINCCQAYKTKEYAFASWDDDEENEKWLKLENAVNETKNMIITYNGEIIEAFFHANSGGRTENVKYVWSGAEKPYLQSVESNEKDIFADSKTFTKEELKELIKSEIKNYDINESKIEILDYTGSGRVNNLKIGDTEIKATKLRSLLNIRSTNFRIEEKADLVTFYTVGYGHGVGLSQVGANEMALLGSTACEIIKHYYTGVEIEEI